jgi:hypothetical protein
MLAHRSALNTLKRLIRHKVRVVGYEDPRQALELEELKAQVSISENPE